MPLNSSISLPASTRYRSSSMKKFAAFKLLLELLVSIERKKLKAQRKNEDRRRKKLINDYCLLINENSG